MELFALFASALLVMVAAALPYFDAMADDLEDTIRENATKPKQAAVDGVSATQHSLPDQIAADKYLASKAATKDYAKSFTRVKIVSPGTV